MVNRLRPVRSIRRQSDWTGDTVSVKSAAACSATAGIDRNPEAVQLGALVFGEDTRPDENGEQPLDFVQTQPSNMALARLESADSFPKRK